VEAECPHPPPPSPKTRKKGKKTLILEILTPWRREEEPTVSEADLAADSVTVVADLATVAAGVVAGTAAEAEAAAGGRTRRRRVGFR